MKSKEEKPIKRDKLKEIMEIIKDFQASEVIIEGTNMTIKDAEPIDQIILIARFLVQSTDPKKELIW